MAPPIEDTMLQTAIAIVGAVIVCFVCMCLMLWRRKAARKKQQIKIANPGPASPVTATEPPHPVEMKKKTKFEGDNDDEDDDDSEAEEAEADRLAKVAKDERTHSPSGEGAGEGGGEGGGGRKKRWRSIPVDPNNNDGSRYLAVPALIHTRPFDDPPSPANKTLPVADEEASMIEPDPEPDIRIHTMAHAQEIEADALIGEGEWSIVEAPSLFDDCDACITLKGPFNADPATYPVVVLQPQSGGDYVRGSVRGVIAARGPGLYTATFPTKNNPGSYVLYAENAMGYPIKETPRLLKIQKFMSGAEYCSVSGVGVSGNSQSFLLPYPANFNIIAANEFGNVYHGGEQFEVVVVDPARETIPCSITDKGTGSYSCSYRPLRSGVHTVSVTLMGAPIIGSPFTPMLENADSGNCVVDGEGLGLSDSGTMLSGYAVHSFIIYARTKSGEPANPAMTEPFFVTITPYSRVRSSGQQSYRGVVQNRGDGTYLVTYDVQGAQGDYQVEIQLHGVHLHGSPFPVSFLSDGAPSAAPLVPLAATASTIPKHVPDTVPLTLTALASGPGCQARVQSEKEQVIFTVAVVHADNHQLLADGTDLDGRTLSAYLEPVPAGGELIVGDISDNGDSTFQIAYSTLGVYGNFLLHVELDDQPIQGCPRPVVVANDFPTPTLCNVFGNGVEGASPMPKSLSLTVQAANEQGTLTHGGADFRMDVVDPLNKQLVQQMQLNDLRNGTYMGVYQTSVTGIYHVSVTNEGVHVSGSPFSPFIEHAHPANCVVESEEYLSRGHTDGQRSFRILTRDRVNRELTEGGGDLFDVQADVDGDPIGAKVVDEGDGTHTVSFDSGRSGEYAIAVKLHNSHIRSSPFFFTLTPKPREEESSVIAAALDDSLNNLSNISAVSEVAQVEADPSQCWIDGHGAGPIVYWNDTDVFSLYAVDKAGNPCEIDGDRRIRCYLLPNNNNNNNNSDLQPIELTVASTGEGEGRYLVSYSTSELQRGLYSLHAEVDQQPVKDTPKVLRIAVFDSNPALCKVTGSGVANIGGSPNQLVEFMVRAVNEDGHVEHGGEAFVAQITDPDGELIDSDLEDKHDGHYICRYRPTVPGLHMVYVFLNETGVASSPYEVLFTNVNAGLCTVAGDGLWDGVAGEKSDEPSIRNFIITGRNHAGETVSLNGEPLDISIVVRQSAEDDTESAVPVELHEDEYGNAVVEYQVPYPGTYTISVKIHDDPIQGSPFTVNISPASAARAVEAAEVAASIPPSKPEASLSSMAVPSLSVAEGPGIGPRVFNKGSQRFAVKVVDQKGNQVPYGGDSINVFLKDIATGDRRDAELVDDHDDGSYSVLYDAEELNGNYELHVRVNGELIRDMPMKLRLRGYNAVPGLCMAFGPGVEQFEGQNSTDQATFTVVTGNNDGKIVTGGDEITVTVTHSNGTLVPSTVKDNEDGTYLCSYHPKESGVYTVHVSLPEGEIPGSPFLVPVEVPESLAAFTMSSESTAPQHHQPSSASASIPGDANKEEEIMSADSSSAIPVEEEKEIGAADSSFSLPVEEAAGALAADSALAVAAAVDEEKKGGEPSAIRSMAEGSGLTDGFTSDRKEFWVGLRDSDDQPTLNREGLTVNVILGLDTEIPSTVELDESNDRFHVPVLRASYDGSQPGNYRVDVQIGERKVGNSPYLLTLTSEFGVNPTECTAEGPGLGPSIMNDREQHFNVKLVDHSGQPFSPAGNSGNAGDANVRAYLVGPGGAQREVDVDQDLGESTRRAVYNPTGLVGDFVLHVEVNGQAIGNGPIPLTIQPGLPKAQAEFCLASGPGIDGVELPNPAIIVINAADKDGLLTHGGDQFTVKVVDGSTGETLVDGAPVEDRGDGTYHTRYAPKRPGMYQVDIQLDNHSIAGSPFYVPVEGVPASAEFTAATGDGINPGVVQTERMFVVAARDADKQPLLRPAQNVTVDITHARDTAIPCTLQDIPGKRGQLLVTYNGERPGNYRIVVKVDGTPIPLSPFLVILTPDMHVDPSQCIAQGSGLGPTLTEDGEESFTVTVTDNKGVVFPGVASVLSHLIAADGFRRPVEIVNNGDGTYTATYSTAGLRGTQTLHIEVNGRKIKNTPVHLTLTPYGSDPEFCTCTGPGVTEVAPPLPLHRVPFTIQAANSAGLVTHGGEPFSSRAFYYSSSSPDEQTEVQCETIIDNGDGTYSCAFFPSAMGFYRVEVLLDDTPVKASPFRVLIENASPSQCQVAGNGVEHAGDIGEKRFEISGKDRNGGFVDVGNEPFEITITCTPTDGSPSQSIAMTDEATEDGRFAVTYNAQVPGTYSVSIMLHGQQVGASPFTVELSSSSTLLAIPDDGVLLANKGEEGEGIMYEVENARSVVYKDEMESFIVRASRADGQPADGLQLTAYLTPISDPSARVLEASVVADQDYVVSFTPTQEMSGKYEVHFENNGLPIAVSGYPASIDVRGYSSNPSLCVVSGPGIEGAKVSAGKAAISITARNEEGKVEHGGENFSVTVTGPRGEQVAVEDLEDQGNGAYSTAYVPNRSGSYTVDVLLDGEHHLHKSPYRVMMQSASAENSWVDGSGLVSGSAEQSKKFTIYFRDAYGGAVSEDQFEVTVHRVADSDDSKTLQVPVDIEDKTAQGESSEVVAGSEWNVTYNAQSPGQYTISVTLHSVDLPGSPFVVHHHPRDEDDLHNIHHGHNINHEFNSQSDQALEEALVQESQPQQQQQHAQGAEQFEHQPHAQGAEEFYQPQSEQAHVDADAEEQPRQSQLSDEPIQYEVEAKPHYPSHSQDHHHPDLHQDAAPVHEDDNAIQNEQTNPYTDYLDTSNGNNNNNEHVLPVPEQQDNNQHAYNPFSSDLGNNNDDSNSNISANQQEKRAGDDYESGAGVSSFAVDLSDDDDQQQQQSLAHPYQQPAESRHSNDDQQPQQQQEEQQHDDNNIVASNLNQQEQAENTQVDPNEWIASGPGVEDGQCASHPTHFIIAPTNPHSSRPDLSAFQVSITCERSRDPQGLSRAAIARLRELRPWLGFEAVDEPKRPGCRVRSLVAGGPMEGSGVHVGDLIVQFNGDQVSRRADIGASLKTVSVGDVIMVKFLLAGKEDESEGEVDGSIIAGTKDVPPALFNALRRISGGMVSEEDWTDPELASLTSSLGPSSSGPQPVHADIRVDDSQSAAVQVEYPRDAIGTYTIGASLQGVPLQGSPWVLNIH